jgi:serine/threonine-protein kinase
MEYLEGLDLGMLLRKEGALPWPRTRRIILQICKALRAAHAQGIVHRDLKPENIFLIEREGRPDFVKLLDFGIAKVTAGPGEEGPRLTRTGMIFGTPEYMAPEQAEGKPADHRVDIYAVGCVLFHCLTGAPPFQAESFMAMLTKHLMEPAVAPSTRRPDLGIPAEADAVALRALEKDRDRRWDTVDQIMVALNSPPTPALGATISTTKTWGSGGAQAVIRPSATGPRTDLFPGVEDDDQPPVARARSGLRIALVVSGLMLGIVGALLWAFRRPPAPPPAATGTAATGEGTAPGAPPAGTPAGPATAGAARPAPAAPPPAAAAKTPAGQESAAPAGEPPPGEAPRERRRPGGRKASDEPGRPAEPTRPRPDPTGVELKPFPQ